MTAANMTLRIDAQDGNTEAKLKQLEGAERKLEASIKSGNRTLKQRLDTEGALEKLNERFIESEKKAATAAQRRAAASLQAQRSAALVAEHHKREAAAKSLAAQRSAALLAQMKEENKANEAADKKMASLGITAVKSIAAMMGISAVGTTIRSVVNEMERLDQAMVDSATRAAELSTGVREFVAIQAAGPGGLQQVRDTLAMGAEFGLTPEQAAGMAQPIQSIADASGEGILNAEERQRFIDDFQAAAKMVQITVTPEDAMRIITAGAARGQTGRQSADLLAMAADLSPVSPRIVAQSISATSEFSDQAEALSILTALAKEQTNTEKLPAAMERLARVLGKSGEIGEPKPFTDKYGLAGLTETEKLQKLYTEGLKRGKGTTEAERVRDFAATFAAEKGLSQENAQELARVVRQAPLAMSTKGQLGQSEGRVDAAIQKLMADPVTAAGIVSQKQKAAAALTDLFGPQAGTAQARMFSRQTEGAAMMREGRMQDVDPSTGMALPIFQRSWFGAPDLLRRYEALGFAAGPGGAPSPMTPRAPIGGNTIADVSAAQEKLIKAIEANTEAMNASPARGAIPKPGGSTLNNSEVPI